MTPADRDLDTFELAATESLAIACPRCRGKGARDLRLRLEERLAEVKEVLARKGDR